MIIVELVRGLGNQMFQYAFSLELEGNGKEVVFCKNYTDEEVEKNCDNTIFDVYNIQEKIITEKQYEEIKKKYNIFLLVWLKIKKNIVRIVEEKEYGKYEKKYLDYDNVVLQGYWQTEKYFINVKDKVLKIFNPKKQFNEKCKSMIKRIQDNKESVSVHLRLGDYSTDDNQRVFGKICTKEYYEKAFRYINEKLDNPVFYVFSNDIEQAKIFFGDNNIVLVDCNDLSEGWADMYLMSLCRNNIIANSTFSWWGAYLNNNKEKIVIAPSKWTNTFDMPDICPTEWVRL